MCSRRSSEPDARSLLLVPGSLWPKSCLRQLRRKRSGGWEPCATPDGSKVMWSLQHRMSRPGTCWALEAPPRYSHLDLEPVRARPSDERCRQRTRVSRQRDLAFTYQYLGASDSRGEEASHPGHNVYEWIATALQTAPINEAPVNIEVALGSRKLNLPHEDPADRFIAATALVFGLTLVTADGHLLDLKEISLLPNR